MKIAKRLLLTPLLLAAMATYTHAQNMYGETLSGVPLKTRVYENVTGSPYLYEDWAKGTVLLDNGTKSAVLDLKFDQVANKLIFKNAAGESLNFANRVKEFTLTTKAGTEIFRRDFPAADDATPDDFFLVLTDQKVKLLKRSKKSIIDSKQYASSNIERSIEEKHSYYLFNGEQLFKFNQEKVLQKVFPENANAIKGYLNEHKLNFKKESDLIELADFCAGL